MTKRKHGPGFSFSGPIGEREYRDDPDEVEDEAESFHSQPAEHAAIGPTVAAVEETRERRGWVARGKRGVLLRAYNDGRLAAEKGWRNLPLMSLSTDPFIRAFRRGYADQQEEARYGEAT